jgi:uncharacterized protein
MSGIELVGIRVHPVKSAAGITVDAAVVEPRGLALDRRWMVVDLDGRFLTGREVPALTGIAPEPDGDRLWLRAPGHPPLAVPIEPAQRSPAMQVGVWRDEVQAVPVGLEADVWLGRVLGVPCRLVAMARESRRPVAPEYGRPGDEVSFADGFPLLLLSRESVADVAARVGEPMDVRRFRPNLVVSGPAPYAEDGWRRLRIGEVELEAVKPCARCAFTTIDPDTAERHPRQEPLRTLAGYRRGVDGGAPLLGVNLVPRSAGTVRRGDPVQVLS